MRARGARVGGAALLWALTVAAHAAATNAPPARTVSSSGQFAAIAPDPLQSSALCVVAERIKRDWLARLDLSDRWRDPVVIIVNQRRADEAVAPAIRAEVFQVEHLLKYQVSCLVPPPLDELALGVTIVQMLNAEYANHPQRPVRGVPYVVAPLPLWLTEGLTQSMLAQPDLLRATLHHALDAGTAPPAAVLMDTLVLPPAPADVESFRAHAWLFTEALLRQPKGADKLQRFLAALGATKSITNAFAAVYSDSFPDTAALEKWWSLERVRQANVVVAENLATGETQRRLSALLTTELASVPVKGGTETQRPVSLVDLWRFYEKPWISEVLGEKLTQLETLRARAHPLYRPIIEEYMAALNLLLQKKLSRYRRAVHVANQHRLAADRRVQQITAVLDRAERSGLIGDYLDQFDR